VRRTGPRRKRFAAQRTEFERPLGAVTQGSRSRTHHRWVGRARMVGSQPAARRHAATGGGR
jgi:hypothetical protein